MNTKIVIAIILGIIILIVSGLWAYNWVENKVEKAYEKGWNDAGTFISYNMVKDLTTQKYTVVPNRVSGGEIFLIVPQR